MFDPTGRLLLIDQFNNKFLNCFFRKKSNLAKPKTQDTRTRCVDKKGRIFNQILKKAITNNQIRKFEMKKKLLDSAHNDGLENAFNTEIFDDLDNDLEKTNDFGKILSEIFNFES